MKLYILRHGDAVPHGDPHYREADRPLTPKGNQRTKELAEALKRWEVSFDVILTSPLVRARETAESVARGLKLDERLQFTPHLAPSGSTEKLVYEINSMRPPPESVLVVGHEPSLSNFISLLCTGGYDLPIDFKKGGLCRLSIDRLKHGRCAMLDWLLAPRLV